MTWQKLASDGSPAGLAPGFSGGISNLGSTAGTSGLAGGRFVLAATSVYSLSQSSAGSGATVTILGNDPIASYWREGTIGIYSTSAGTIVNGQAWFQRMDIPHQVSFTRVDIPMSLSVATTASAVTAGMQLSAVAVLYSRAISGTGAVLTPIVGVSSTTTYSWASNTGVYLSITGARIFSFAMATNLRRGEYYMGLQWSTDSGSSLTEAAATTALNASLQWVQGRVGNEFFDLPGVQTNVAGASSMGQLFPLAGSWNPVITTAGRIVSTGDLIVQGLVNFAANQFPIIILRGN